MFYHRVISQVESLRRREEADRGPQARRLREIESLRQRILDAAETILVEDGYESLSMRRLADAIEYAPSTIYGYFRDKKAIVSAVLDRTTTQLLDALEQAALTPGPLTRLRMLGRAYVEFAFKYPRQYEVLFVLRGANVPVIDTPAFGAAVAKFREAIGDGVRANAFRRCNPDETAQAFWAACHGLVSLILTQSDRFDFVEPDRLLEAMLTLQIEGLRPATFGLSSAPKPAEPTTAVA
ncbi:MAG: TetR/AcrR family transcriptional regulator [Armatimonadetes bacterium]|nr:TetR/AcrR family transcriptional regulator [Armatimonadota bacterium]